MRSIFFGFGPSVSAHLPRAALVVLTFLSVESGCAFGSPLDVPVPLLSADTTGLEDRALCWHVPRATRELRGLRLLYDTPHPTGSTLAVVHWIVRSNHRLDPFDALELATTAADVAGSHHLDARFFASVLLQESGFDPRAFSAAGAVGIGQFTLDTAADLGIDPFDWRDAMGGSAALVGRYVNAYDGVYPDPYAASLAAYNAGPGTVSYYRGVPPYPETREYIADIYDRWARILYEMRGRRAGAR